jgi:thioredoxin-like negative regulator of GroEL
VLLAAFATLVLLGVVLTRTMARIRVGHVMAQPGQALLEQLGVSQDGRHTLVAFSTPSCAACHTAQAPAVTQVHETVGEERLRIIKVDAARQPAVARAFGVLTVPSTVVLAPDGNLLAVNHGFAPPNKLVHQLQHT